MNVRVIVLSFFLLLANPLLGRDKTDVMIMNNGDRMTCEVKGLSSGVLYVAFDYIDGTASVDWSKVARLESSQLFVVRAEDGSVYMGTLKTPETGSGRPVQITVVQAAEHETSLDRSQITQMIATSDKFWQRFSGTLSFGVSYAKGNQSTQYNLGSQTAYVRERWSAGANFGSNLSSSTGTSPATRNSLNLSAMHLLPPKNWFYAGIGDFLQSSTQGISLQSTLGMGVGRYLKNTNRASIAVLAGGAWQNTNYQKTGLPPIQENLGAGLIYAEAKFFKFSKTSLNVTASLLPALSDPGRLRFNTNATYYFKIFSNLKWDVSFYGNWDTQPPPGFAGSDYGTSSGLSWTFGLK
jgi:hypothetical protein